MTSVGSKRGIIQKAISGLESANPISSDVKWEVEYRLSRPIHESNNKD